LPVRPEEGLVVEAGGEEGMEPLVDRAEIEAERGPAVLTARDEPADERSAGGAHARRPARAFAHRDERATLVEPGRGDASRPVLLEAARDQVHAVGEERRGERVARVAGEAPAVETKIERSPAVDPAAGREAKRLAHEGFS